MGQVGSWVMALRPFGPSHAPFWVHLQGGSVLEDPDRSWALSLNSSAPWAQA